MKLMRFHEKDILRISSAGTYNFMQYNKCLNSDDLFCVKFVYKLACHI